MSTGRRKDGIWKYFTEKKPDNSDLNILKSKRVECKKCHTVIVGLVARMKTHVYETCTGSSINNDNELDSPSTSNQCQLHDQSEKEAEVELVEVNSGKAMSNPCEENISEIVQPKRQKTNNPLMNTFVIRTTQYEKEKLDNQVARFIFASNSPFRTVEHPQFVKMMSMLRPGYHPPNRHKIANELLNDVYDSLSKLIKLELDGKTVCMALDGWSNIHNESIICVCVTDMSDTKNAVYLLDTIDTKDNSHTWDYLVQLAENTIKLCESFGCTVGSVVTDNASNMNKMRTNLAMSEGLNNKHIITYGCSAHLLNLFAHDIEAVGVKTHVKSIFKYFRNTHFFAAKYKLEGGKSLILPQDVRWNTLSDTIQCYLDNWHILYKVCDENRTACNPTIFSKVKDTDMKTTAKEYLVKLKKISITLDKVQADGCTLSEATHLWLELKQFFELEVCNDSMVEKVQKRFDMAVTEYHLIAYVLDPKYRGIKMNSDQMDSTLDFINLYHQEIMPEIITYQAEAYPFKDYLFKEQTVSQVKPLTWWLSLKKNISSEMLSLVTKLFTASASSAGVERIFSSYGLVHSKLRNRLGIEKSSKLVTIFKSLNKDFTYD